jgi:hypothetical protein
MLPHHSCRVSVLFCCVLVVRLICDRSTVAWMIASDEQFSQLKTPRSVGLFNGVYYSVWKSGPTCASEELHRWPIFNS